MTPQPLLVKSLIAKFSYNKLQPVLRRERWRLPTSKELKESGYDVYSVVWVSDPHPEPGRAYVYYTLSGALVDTNRSFKMNVAVIKLDKGYNCGSDNTEEHY